MDPLNTFYFIVLYVFVGWAGGLVFSTETKKAPTLIQNAIWFTGVAVVAFLVMYLPRSQRGEEVNMVAILVACLITASSFVTARHMKIVERGK